MTIQRQYSLPNCRLVLEGWGDNVNPTSTFMEGRPILTILTNAECHFPGQENPLSGGREFLDQLVASVNHYAQQVLSGIPHAMQATPDSSISLAPTDKSHHCLTVRRSPDKPLTHDASPNSNIQLKLSTVQLFDLVEAIDQMVADAQTLPDMYLDLTPVPKRSVSSQEPMTRQIIPAALGISSVAVAAFALFFMPVPEFEITEPGVPTTEETTDTTSTGEPDSETEPEPEPDLNAVDSTEDVEPATEPSVSTIPPESIEEPSVNGQGDNATPPSQEEIEEFFTAVAPIADSDQLDALTAQLRTQIVEAWTQDPSFDDDLEYRVGVSENGQIVGYKYENDAAITHADEIPLSDLTQFPILDTINVDDPIAQFRVVFLPSGVVEVSPWYGRLPDNDES